MESLDKYDLVWECDDYPQYTGEQKLLLAIIFSAAKDYNSKNKPRRDAAKRWLNSKKEHPFSFLWCLQHLCPEYYDVIDIPKLIECLKEKAALRNQCIVGIEYFEYLWPYKD